MVVTEKRVFVSGDESNVMAQFKIFGLPDFHFHDARNTENKSRTNSPPKVFFFHWLLDGKTQTCNFRENWDWIRRWIKIITTIGFFGSSEIWGEREIEWLYYWALLNMFEAFDWDLDGKIRPVVTEKFEIEFWDESNLLSNLDSSDNQNAEQSSKQYNSWKNISAKVSSFSYWEFWNSIST